MSSKVTGPKLPGWIDKGLRSPMAAAAAISMGIKLSQESQKLRSGEIDREEFRKRASQHMGAITGTLAGVGIGAAFGHFWPGPGRLMGAFLGGLLGEQVGRDAIARLGEAVWPAEAAEPAEDEASPQETTEAVGEHDPEVARRDL